MSEVWWEYGRTEDKFGNKIGDVRVFLAGEETYQACSYACTPNYTGSAYVLSGGNDDVPYICIKEVPGRIIVTGDMVIARCIQIGPDCRFSLWEEISDE